MAIKNVNADTKNQHYLIAKILIFFKIIPIDPMNGPKQKPKDDKVF